MNIQIFGTKKCFDTKKAERWFKERNIKYQYIDMKEKGMSKGEFTSVKQAVGGIDSMINENAKDKDTLVLMKYLSDEDREEKLLENPQLITGMQFATAGFGWHLDVGLHMTRLILSGIFDKLPNLKFISGHWGETIPFMLDRMDQIMRPQTTGLKKRVSDYFHENVWYTPSGILSKDNFEYMVKVFGADHIIWALDYPYVPFNACSADFLLNADIPYEDKELIAHKNAEKLLHIK
jgi:arsenate reductase-like glutaredoxin family protein